MRQLYMSRFSATPKTLCFMYKMSLHTTTSRSIDVSVRLQPDLAPDRSELILARSSSSPVDLSKPWYG